ncbi:hypothetical protein [Oligella urethralis]|uniref:hypothetical protein n=1 Tax=Oligella urethralis TaxID=90245 RepID=UPI002889B0B5|nr:hypothetical protein [Oligella urethralis]
MAIYLDERYPGRAGPKTLDYPQGSFKNRTSPTSKDGTYLEQDWANDMLAFFQSMLKKVGITANGQVDTAQASQYFDALIKNIQNSGIAHHETAPTTNQGLVIYDLQHDIIKRWRTIGAFEGYASNQLGLVQPGTTQAVRGYEIEAVGGIVNKADYPALWAFAQAQSLVKTTHKAGEFSFIDVDSTRFRLPDLRNQFIRFTGTDADNANARVIGSYQADSFRSHKHNLKTSEELGNGYYAFNDYGTPGTAVGQYSSTNPYITQGVVFDTYTDGGAETRGQNTALAPRIIAF